MREALSPQDGCCCSTYGTIGQSVLAKGMMLREMHESDGCGCKWYRAAHVDLGDACVLCGPRALPSADGVG